MEAFGSAFTEVIKILTEKDFQIIRSALSAEKFVCITRTLGGVTITVRTCPASPMWEVPMLARLEVQRGNLYMTQYFESVEAMREAVKEVCST